MCACMFSCSILCDPMDCSLPGCLSRGFSRQEYWSGLPFPSLGDLPNPGIQPVSPALPGGSFTTEQPGKHSNTYCCSVAKSCPTLCDPVDYSTPGFPVHHQLLELAQTHVRRVGNTIQPTHSLSSPSLPAFDLFQHQGFPNESVLCIRWPVFLGWAK